MLIRQFIYCWLDTVIPLIVSVVLFISPNYVIASEQKDIQAHDGEVVCLGYLPGDKNIVSVGVDGMIRVWEVSTRRKLQELDTRKRVGTELTSARLSGSVLATGYRNGMLHIWSIGDTIQWKRSIEAHVDRVYTFSSSAKLLSSRIRRRAVSAIDWSPDQRWIATTSEFVTTDDDGSIAIWDSRTGRERLRLIGHTSGVNSVVFSPDGLSLASGGDDKTIRLWRTSDGKALLCLKRDDKGRPVEERFNCGVSSVSFSKNGDFLISSGKMGEFLGDYTLRVWSVDARKQIEIFTKLGCAASIVLFSSDGKYMAAAAGDELHIWGQDGGGKVFRPAHYRVSRSKKEWIFSTACFSHSAKQLASADLSGRLVFTDSESNK